MTTTIAIDLPDELIERIADRVAAKLGKPAEPWLGVDAAAAYLACPRSRIYDLIAQHKLEVRRDGRRVLTRREWCDAALGGGK
jgi:excisionase family DNA binding protein